METKLFKCTRSDCRYNMENEGGPFVLTEEEYSTLDSEGKIICPCNPPMPGKCGLEEVKQEDHKPPPPIKKLFLIAGGIVGVLLIVGAIILFASKSDSKQKTIKTEQEVKQMPEKPTQAKPEEVDKPEKPTTTPPGNQTKTFSDGSKYVGEIKNGKMHGLGTYYYGERQLISQKDLKKRYAEKGDYLIGEFYEGNVVSGKLYDSQNNVKEVIMIGR